MTLAQSALLQLRFEWGCVSTQSKLGANAEEQYTGIAFEIVAQ